MLPFSRNLFLVCNSQKQPVVFLYSLHMWVALKLKAPPLTFNAGYQTGRGLEWEALSIVIIGRCLLACLALWSMHSHFVKSVDQGLLIVNAIRGREMLLHQSFDQEHVRLVFWQVLDRFTKNVFGIILTNWPYLREISVTLEKLSLQHMSVYASSLQHVSVCVKCVRQGFSMCLCASNVCVKPSARVCVRQVFSMCLCASSLQHVSVCIKLSARVCVR